MSSAEAVTQYVHPYPETVPFEGMLNAVAYPHESLRDSYEPGTTEPWIAEIVAALVKAHRPKFVIELGGFVGTTTAWIALAMESVGGGSLWVSEPDPARAEIIEKRLEALDIPTVCTGVSRNPSPQILEQVDKRSIDFAFVDNDHQPHHVEQEICNLWEKMAPKGIIAFHDVSGICGLGPIVRKYGGIALDLPKLGPDGGLGLIQVMH